MLETYVDGSELNWTRWERTNWTSWYRERSRWNLSDFGNVYDLSIDFARSSSDLRTEKIEFETQPEKEAVIA